MITSMSRKFANIRKKVYHLHKTLYPTLKIDLIKFYSKIHRKINQNTIDPKTYTLLKRKMKKNRRILNKEMYLYIRVRIYIRLLHTSY